MATEIAVPFQLAQDGGIGVVTDPLTQIGMHVEALVATGPGERVILGSYGVAARNAVFSPDNQVIGQAMQNDVIQAMRTWEPNVNVISVTANSQEAGVANSTAVTVNWSPSNAQNPADPGVYTSTILVGGSVV
jgi:phage baseplate assembly protein W